MRRRLTRAAILSGVGIIIAACGSFGTASDPSSTGDGGDSGPTSDGAVAPPDDSGGTVASDGGSLVDGGASADASGCNDLVGQPQLIGSAEQKLTETWLTNGVLQDQVGAMWFGPAGFAKKLIIEVDTRVTTSGATPGQGLAVSWLPTTVNPKINTTNKYGICQISDGMTVSYDTEVNERRISSSSTCSGGVTQSATITNDQTIIVELEGNTFKVIGPGQGSASGTVTNPGKLVISASTTSNRSAHIVRAVRIRSCQ